MVLGTALATTGSSVGELLLICAVGLLLYRQGLFTKETSVNLSKLIFLLLTPCLILSAPGAYKLSTLRQWYVLPLLCLFQLLVGALTSKLATAALGVRGSDEVLVRLSTTFANNGAVPFVLMDAVARTWDQVTRDRDEAAKDAISMVFVFILPWQLIYFSYAVYRVKELAASKQPDDETKQGTSVLNGATANVSPALRSGSASAEQLLASDHDAPSIEMETLLPPQVGSRGTGVGEAALAPRLQEGSGEPYGAAAATRLAFLRGNVWLKHAQWLHRAVLTNPVVAILLAMLVANTPLFDALNSKAATFLRRAIITLGGATIPLNTLILASSLGRVGGQVRALQHDGGFTKFVVLICTLKLVVSVIVCVPIILALRAAGIFGSDPDPLVVLLALIEPAMPSSQTLVVLLNMEGLTDAASRLGAAYVIQYCLSVLTISIVMTVCITVLSTS